MSNQPTLVKTLDNGLSVLLREAHSAPVAEIQIWARVGSADERPGEEGLAHFHEHMLFKGTARRGLGEIAGEIEGVGGRINAYTSFDVTVYHATLPSAEVETGLDVLVDAVRHSEFSPEEIQREIEVVIEEIHRSKDTPGDVLSDAIFAEVYREHPYGAPILGTVESVSRFEHEQVRQFFERWYAPDNLTVVAVGDFDAEALLAKIEEQFEDAAPRGAQHQRPAEPRQGALRSVLLRRPFERSHLELTFPATGFAHPDTPLLDLLAFILGEGESSRLVRDLREDAGLVDNIYAACYTPLDAGIFGIGATLDPDNAREVIGATLRRTERLRRERVSAEELEKARTNFLSAEYFERESVSGTAHKLGNFQILTGDHRHEERYLAAIREATPEALRAVARKYLAPERLTVGLLEPEDAPALDHAAIEAIVNEASREVAQLFLPPIPRRSGSEQEILTYALGNGATLHVAPRGDVPVVALRAAFLGGLLAEPDAAKQAGLSHFLAGMWIRGTTGHCAADFARKAEGLAAEIDGFSGRSTLGLTLDIHSEALEPALDLFADALLHPAFDPEEIERERRDTLATLLRREDNLAALDFELFAKTLFPHHPYGHSVLGSAESVASFSRDDLQTHFSRLVSAPNAMFGVAGAVDPDRIAEGLSTRLADLPSVGEPPALPECDAVPTGIRSVELHKDRAQTHTVLGFPGVSVLDPDRFALDVISQILAGQSGRLFLELRDKQSLAYALSASSAEGLAPGYFAVYIATAPEKVELARSGILAELDRLVQGPVPTAELERARRNIAGCFAIDQQRSSTRAAHLAHDALYGLGPAASEQYAAQITAVSAEDVLRVARRILRLDAYTLATVCP